VLTADTAVEIGARGRLEVGRLATVISPRVRVIAAGGRVTGTAQRGKQDGGEPGTIQGDLALAPGSVLELEADADGGPALRVEGNVEAAGLLELRFPGDAALAADDLLDLLDFTGSFSGAFEGVTSPDRTGDFAATVEVDGGGIRVRIVTPGQALDTEGETEGDGGEEGETEGEPVPPGPGCNGCQPSDGKLLPPGDAWGSWLVWLLGAALLLGSGVQRRRHTAGAC
jgi:hypothetical protein